MGKQTTTSEHLKNVPGRISRKKYGPKAKDVLRKM